MSRPISPPPRYSATSVSDGLESSPSFLSTSLKKTYHHSRSKSTMLPLDFDSDDDDEESTFSQTKKKRKPHPREDPMRSLSRPISSPSRPPAQRPNHSTVSPVRPSLTDTSRSKSRIPPPTSAPPSRPPPPKPSTPVSSNTEPQSPQSPSPPTSIPNIPEPRSPPPPDTESRTPLPTPNPEPSTPPSPRPTSNSAESPPPPPPTIPNESETPLPPPSTSLEPSTGNNPRPIFEHVSSLPSPTSNRPTLDHPNSFPTKMPPPPQPPRPLSPRPTRSQPTSLSPSPAPSRSSSRPPSPTPLASPTKLTSDLASSLIPTSRSRPPSPTLASPTKVTSDLGSSLIPSSRSFYKSDSDISTTSTTSDIPLSISNEIPGIPTSSSMPLEPSAPPAVATDGVTFSAKLENALKLAELMTRSLDIRDRFYHLKKLKRCFLGDEAVEWMISTKHARSVEEALDIGNLLIKQNVIIPVAGLSKATFVNYPVYYRFQQNWVNGLSSKDYDPRSQETVSKRFIASELVTLSLGPLHPAEFLRQHIRLSVLGRKGGSTNEKTTSSSSVSGTNSTVGSGSVSGTSPSSTLPGVATVDESKSDGKKKGEIPLGHAELGCQPPGLKPLDEGEEDNDEEDSFTPRGRRERADSAALLAWRPDPWLAEGTLTLYSRAIGYFKAWVSFSYS